MADALDSKSSVRKDVWVRLPPLVLNQLANFARILHTVADALSIVVLSIFEGIFPTSSYANH